MLRIIGKLNSLKHESISLNFSVLVMLRLGKINIKFEVLIIVAGEQGAVRLAKLIGPQGCEHPTEEYQRPDDTLLEDQAMRRRHSVYVRLCSVHPKLESRSNIERSKNSIEREGDLDRSCFAFNCLVRFSGRVLASRLRCKEGFCRFRQVTVLR